MSHIIEHLCCVRAPVSRSIEHFCNIRHFHHIRAPLQHIAQGTVAMLYRTLFAKSGKEKDHLGINLSLYRVFGKSRKDSDVCLLFKMVNTPNS